LKFFEKDSIDWKDYSLTSFYQKLISTKKENEALWNGFAGGSLQRINLTDNKHVLAIQRTKGANTVIGIFNFTAKSKTFAVESYISGEYTDVFSGNTVELHQYKKMQLAPWEFLILVKK
jgi:glycosidase